MHDGLSPDPELPSQSRACESMGSEGVIVQLELLPNRSWVILGEGIGVEVHLVADAEALVFLFYGLQGLDDVYAERMPADRFLLFLVDGEESGPVEVAIVHLDLFLALSKLSLSFLVGIVPSYTQKQILPDVRQSLHLRSCY